MSTQLERAIEKIQTKETVSVDFTQHTLEDGIVVSTQERVVKDVRRHLAHVINRSYFIGVVIYRSKRQRC